MLILLGSFLGLMILGVPVAIAMAVASLAFILISGNVPDVILAQRMIAGVESFPLLAVPFFILAGNLMNIAGVTGRIYAFAVALVGWMRGGLAQVNIIGSVIFSGMSGTAIADAAGIGTIEIKAMKDHGYPVEAAVGVTAASATLGPIFPPSLPFVIYGMMANVSIGALFLAGILPGLVMTVLMMGTVALIAYKRGWGSDTGFDWKKLAEASMEVGIVLGFPLIVYALIWAGLSVNVALAICFTALIALDWYFDWSAVMALMTPIILIGGMTMGWFTPTEAAAAAVIWSLFLGLVRYRSMTLRSLTKATFDTIETTASVLFIVTAASIFAWLLTVSQAAQLFSDFGYFVFDNERSFSICGGPKAETVTTSFHYPSFGATLNFLFAAVGRVGQQSILHNAALNPEVIDTITLLQSMGAEIAWDANRTLSVTGPRKLQGVSHQILGDRVFAATLAAAVACTRGEALVTGVGAEYLANEFEVWQAAGLRVQPTATGFGVACPDRLTARDVSTRPYPGFHTDIQPLHTVMMSLARGTSRVTETILDDRFRYCPELVRMGARIDVVDGGFTCVNGQEGKIAVVEGVERLHASDVQATDIRGGAAVVVAALAAEGRTSIGNVYQLDRGYADLATVLSSLGARIQRVNATYSPASSAEQNTPLNKRGAACLTPLPG